jgi:hypothetical protein
MLDSKFFITLIGLAVVLFAVSSQSINPITEDFINYPMASLASPVTCNKKGGCSSTPINYVQGMNKFLSYPSYQAMLSPRTFSGSYGANIQYTLPPEKNLAVPSNPLTFGNMAKCNYNTKENFEPSKKMSYNQALQDVYQNNKLENLLPDGVLGGVNDMTSLSANGQNEQIYNYDRFIFSTAKSRLTAQGDPIRGDLPIIPNACGWFSPSVNPSRDLQTGAMNVMGGNNETSNSVAQLRLVASGFTDPASSGVLNTASYATPSAMNALNNMYNISQAKQGADVIVNNGVQLQSPMVTSTRAP